MPNDKLYVRDGLYLSGVKPNDKAAFVEHLKEKAIHETTSNIPYPYSEEDAVKWINRCTAGAEKQGKEQLFAIRQSNGYLIGSVGIGDIEIGQTHRAELGYWLAKPYWGQGITTDAVRVFVKYAFKELAVVRLYTQVYDFNIGSWKVLEKNGFKLEGLLRKHIYRDGRYIDDRLYGLLKEEWEAMLGDA
ncbi:MULTISPECIES: GNAT family protein [unclassified Microcoleus]|uniref:GNAT family N-acetyltransferase n=1 Tax=unclassified Microcoleus TaxID=2642155 RepID=UPI002FD22580